ncbi:di-heme enzyme [Neptunicella marina]|uniref:Di-heme enzyme n=1 Tax=Neptunicella marina TaxID=2125989 RepID=A0A8J6IVQ0_9ALTE|nr:di-heme enzyme [Neptunicella marina]
MRLGVIGWVSFLLVVCSPSPDTKPFNWSLPTGFPTPLVPDDNPMTEAKVALGRVLFYDINLSFNQTQACASCHQQQYAFAEPLKHSVGSTGEAHRRNAQSLVNVAYNGHLTWSNNALNSIEQQILIPMFSETPHELNITGHENEVLQRFQTEAYQQLNQRAFGEKQLTFDHIVKALASFVRSLLSFDSAFDRYAYQGNDNALNESELRGMNLFFSERLECHHCHGGFNFTQSSVHQQQQLDLSQFHNTGLYNLDGKGAFPDSDPGLIEITGDPKDMGRFRAPTLRNVALSAPYMHDGSLNTLDDVIEFYNLGGQGAGVTSPLKSPFIRPLYLSVQEKQDLKAFLMALTDPRFVSNPAFAALPAAGE